MSAPDFRLERREIRVELTRSQNITAREATLAYMK
jgi:hypothetical protein